MSSECKLVVELWDYFREMLPAGKRVGAATHLLRLFEEYGFEVDLNEIEGECEYLDEAIELLADGEDEEELDNDWDDQD